MKSRFRILVLAAAALSPAGSLLAEDSKARKTLAHRLPADTLYYAQTNVPALLTEAGKYLEFIDAETAKGFTRELKTLHGLVKEIGTHYEFKPILFDTILESDLYLIFCVQTKPQVRGRKSQTAEGDATFSLVIETTPKGAQDFLEQFKGLAERLQEKNPDKNDYEYKELEVEEGELLAVGTDGFTLGRRDRYLVISSGKPEKLWTALDSSPDTSLAETELFQRYHSAKSPPVCLALLNLGAWILQAEESLKHELTEAKKRSSNEAASGTDEEDNPAQGGFDQGADEEMVAQQALTAFQTVKKLFSLDQIKVLGAKLAWQTGKQDSHGTARIDLLLGEKISPALRQTLDGGQRFQLPPVGKLDRLCVFVRAGIAKILEDVMAGLDESTSQQYQQSMMMMKVIVGYTAGEILNHLAGDLYFFVDVKEKEHPTHDFDDKSGEVTTKTVVGPVPELFLLLGVNDREAFSKVLSDLVTRVSSGPLAAALGSFVGQRVYQGIDVYLVGQGLDIKGHEPDGLTSYAMVVVDRYLTFGSWKEVTALIRRAKAAEKGTNRKLAAIVTEHQQSNLLVVVPTSWSKKIQKMSDEANDEVWDKLIDELLKKLLELTEDEDVKTRFQGAFKRAQKHLTALSMKAQDLAADPSVGDGKLSEKTYTAKTDFVHSKTEKK